MGDRSRANWLDQARLLFAAMVVFSHSIELTSQPQAPASRPLGTATYGEIAVCGFFVLSGYLISAAWLRNPHPATYLRNRLLRIGPAYLAAFLISTFIVGAIGAADAFAYWRAIDWRVIAQCILTFDQPITPPTFVGSIDPQVNGAMWTIQYEFACYLIAPLALYRRATLIPLWLLAGVVTLLTPSEFARFMLMFLTGAVCQVFAVKFDKRLMWVSAALLPLLMAFDATWAIGLGTVGAYLLLGLGVRERHLPAPPDISYGLYLYGSPTLKLLILAGLAWPPILFPVALAISGLCGAASWYGIERRALRWKRRVERADQAPGVAVVHPLGNPDLIERAP